ncbi:Ca2+/Na+ antiporter [Candidatus Nanohalobium constans]|uniref:Ca2+/Na+ antiporter n=1 Tax=Candidatus Nanohalobium constans TaxID=2565781 RepID=A0A5Q0UG43_9ARCH|nr:Ca2+/Na+ antiporter [Candidatus Nanohalobium constans]
MFLVYAAEIVVSRMQRVAKYYGVSEVVIAMTIVSIGTSLPELSLHLVGSVNILLSDGNLFPYIFSQPISFLLDGFQVVLSSPESVKGFQDVSATVLGSNIGSDVVQQTLVLGLVIFSSALLADKHSFNFSRKFLIRDYAPMMGTTLMTLILALNWPNIINFLFNGGQLAAGGTLTRLDGLVLVGSFVAYIFYLYTTRKEELAEQGSSDPSTRPRIDFAVGILAMFAVIGSAEIFLEVVEMAIAQTGLSGSMIGVASVGVVSAFPEMITAISGLRQGSEGISLGTLIGSNITNPLLAIGAGSLISTYAVPGPLVLWDLPVETATAGILLTYMFSKDAIGDHLAVIARKFGMDGLAERFEAMENRVISIAGAFLLILLYFVYLYVRFKYFQYDFVEA